MNQEELGPVPRAELGPVLLELAGLGKDQKAASKNQLQV